MNSHNVFSLKNKTILITGATSGIGRQCAISCSKMDANLILLGRDEERMRDTQSRISNSKIVISCNLDLTDFEGVAKFVENLKNKPVKINGIIHSAGISVTLPFRLSSSEKMDHFFNVNVVGAMNLTRLLSKRDGPLQEGASIIFITSIMAIVGETGKSLYCMTKGALLAGARAMAIEFAKRNTRINCVSPGVVKTPMSGKAIYNQDETSRKNIAALHPLGLGDSEDVANTCIFLLSEASKWITGSNIIVDGGYSAR